MGDAALALFPSHACSSSLPCLAKGVSGIEQPTTFRSVDKLTRSRDKGLLTQRFGCLATKTKSPTTELSSAIAVSVGATPYDGLQISSRSDK